MKKHIITAIEQDGLDVHTFALCLETVEDDLDIKQAVKNACEEYIKTPAGKATLEYNSGYFDWADFAMNVPNEICKKYGFTKIEADENYIVSWGEQLIDG